MTEDGYITRAEEDAALAEKLVFAKPGIGIRAPHFVMYVKNILENRYGTRTVERGGLRIKTTLDIDVQDMADSVVRNQIAQLTRLKVGNGAALITDPRTGEILAMVGSRDYFDLAYDGNVNVTASLRQPGSSIKVVNYAAALENGFTAASILDDSPVMYQTPGSPPYVPVNYDGRYHGPTPLRYALGNSYNIPAVKVLAKIGVKTMIEKGRLMGIRSWEDESRYGLSLTLGGGDITMLEMAEVYGTLANLGKHVNLMPVSEVSDYTGKLIERFKPDQGIQAVNPDAAFIISDILRDNNARSAAFGVNSNLVITGKKVSVKTGTSNDKRDNWTIGFTPSRVVTVWVGNNDNSPMDPLLTSGVTGAAPIWHDIMSELIKNMPDEVQPKPESVSAIPCYFGRNEYFINGTAPSNGRCSPLTTPTPPPVNTL
jgi:membrane peptidoglycan carboxypeptidase